MAIIALAAAPVWSAEPLQPAALYREYCSVCHGEAGDGHSRAMANLIPPPRDFTSPQSAVELTRERMVRSIRDGRPGTAMTPWGSQLSHTEIQSLADYIRERFMVPVAYDPGHEGRRIYAEYCSVCHGDRGDGNSRAARSLNPRPTDFTSSRARRELSMERMVFSVTYGRANTAMAPWQHRLSPEEISSVVGYVRGIFMNLDEPIKAAAPAPGQLAEAEAEASRSGAGSQEMHGSPHVSRANFAAPFPGGISGNPAVGQGLYRINCSPCHGDRGDGRGPRAFFVFPKPRDFGHPAARASFDRPRLYESIWNGKLRTEMPAWGKVLSAQQVADIGEYVLRTFIRPGIAPDPQH